ncbi:hypothetical protein AGMMS49525_18400 [Bacteroidia bacterium]|nr:hypothetical protein AGMMS49525_18400 [Bacteroidia bacterium]
MASIGYIKHFVKGELTFCPACDILNQEANMATIVETGYLLDYGIHNM